MNAFAVAKKGLRLTEKDGSYCPSSLYVTDYQNKTEQGERITREELTRILQQASCIRLQYCIRR